MIDEATASVFETLTAKQRQAMALAADGLTSKEIARELDISPHSVDKRIDAVRGRLDARPRSQIVRDYRAWSDRTGEPITGDRSPLTHPSPDAAPLEPQPEGETLPFDDALIFERSSEWDRQTGWLHRGVKPSDLGVGGRLLFVVAGAFLVAAAFVLVAASGNVLIDLLS